jgi:MEMO1 family protein
MGSTTGKTIGSSKASAMEQQQQQDEEGSHHRDATAHHRRRAHHAGSWYESHPETLRRTLNDYLSAAAAAAAAAAESSSLKSATHSPEAASSELSSLRAMICPHAGYSYSGPTAAYSYQALCTELSRGGGGGGTVISPIEHILVLHPSHHVHLRGQCAVSSADTLETPLGDLPVDGDLRRDILNLSDRYFTTMSIHDDEREHSGEMQYPFIAHCLQSANTTSARISRSITVTPVMCGSLDTADERAIGTLLAEIIARPNVLTVVSTDFCHWGRRFRFQPTSLVKGETISDFIAVMDRRGMDMIAAQQPGAFADYLKETGNTICGRHAVAVWLRAVEAMSSLLSSTNPNYQPLSIQLVHYAQSSAARTESDSSVSYAAAVATVETRG